MLMDNKRRNKEIHTKFTEQKLTKLVNYVKMNNAL